MKISKDFVLRNVCGDCLLVPLGEKAKEYNGVFSLSETGAYILQRLSEQKEIKEIAELLSQEFEIDSSSAYEDTLSFTESLKEFGILID